MDGLNKSMNYQIGSDSAFAILARSNELIKFLVNLEKK